MGVRINLGKELNYYNCGLEIDNIPFELLKSNLLISGSDQAERTAFLSHILNQLYKRAPEIGVLLIRLNAGENTNVFHLDKEYKYGDLNLEIPYFYGDFSNEVYREHFESVISALFGFHFEMKIVIGCLLRQYKNGKLPSSILDFLGDLKNYLVDHPYSEKFNKSNIESIEIMLKLFEEKEILERTLWKSFKTPEWLKLWSEGKKICIDLSRCDLRYQRILVPLLLQIVKNSTPILNSDTPVGIVALEDASELFKDIPVEEYKNNFNLNKEYYKKIENESYFLTREQLIEVYGDKDYLINTQLEYVFKRLVFTELFYRDIAIIATCRDPAELYLSYKKQFKIKLDLD
jgi:hypothetical protein